MVALERRKTGILNVCSVTSGVFIYIFLFLKLEIDNILSQKSLLFLHFITFYVVTMYL